MKKALIGFVVVVAIAVAVAVFWWPSYQFKKSLAENINQMPGIESFTYDSAGYNLLARTMHIKGLKVVLNNEAFAGTYNVGSIVGSGVPLSTLTALLKRDAALFNKDFKIFEELNIKDMNYAGITKDEPIFFNYTQASSLIKNVSYQAVAGPLPRDFKEPGAMAWLAKSIKYDSSQDENINMEFGLGNKGRDDLSPVNFKIAAASSTGYNNFKIENFTLKGLTSNFEIKDSQFQNEADQPKPAAHKFAFTLDNFTIKNLDLTTVGALLVLDLTNEENLQNFMMQRNPFFSFYGYDSVESGPFSCTINGKPLVTMSSAVSTGPVTTTAFPENIKSSLKGLAIDFSAIPLKPGEENPLQPLFDLNYQNISMDLDLEMVYSAQNKTLNLKTYAVNINKAFLLDMSLAVSGLDVGGPETTLDTVGYGLMGVAFDKYSISLTDQGLAERLIPYLSQKVLANDDPRAIINMAKTILDENLTPAAIFLSNADAIGAELKAFLDNPAKIKISTGNKEPIMFMSFVNMNGPQVLSLLMPNIQVNDRAPVEASFTPAFMEQSGNSYNNNSFDELNPGDLNEEEAPSEELMIEPAN